MTSLRQPFQHDLLIALQAPTQAWSDLAGQIRANQGVGGYYHGDVRVISEAILTVNGEEPETIASGSSGQGHIRVIGLTRSIDDPGADPTARIERHRHVTSGKIVETIEFSGATAEPIQAHVQLELACDLATMESVKSGHETTEIPVLPMHDETMGWENNDVAIQVESDSNRLVASKNKINISWDITVTPGRVTKISWTVHASDSRAVVQAAPTTHSIWATPTVVADDRRLNQLVTQALEDLSGLQMTTIDNPDDVFLAAGAPWFFTLFGRDSLWAARLMLPLGTTLAAGTLRTLAAFQGTAVDPATAEQPGKILHEMRRDTLVVADNVEIPPIYYGTIDATPLWINVLHDAWKWGMPKHEVQQLLPALESALAWMSDFGDSDGDGFLEYRDESGQGLANQGWKDSGDSIQFIDGTLAEGPIALVEVQAYAYEAAISGAALLDAFGLSGSDRWRDWAANLAKRFRETFWLTDDLGPYLGVALDGSKRVVDTVTSNMGHVLGTGILSTEESAIIAQRLVHPTLASGFGLRTMSTTSKGYWPLKYHGGSVWPHDTAIAITGLAKDGHGDQAGALALGLLAAAEKCDYRLPELFSGDSITDVPWVIPYPASCRPQAWSAASAIAILSALSGLRVENNTIHADPVKTVPVGALAVNGLQYGSSTFGVKVDAQGRSMMQL